jgi:DNA-3-methyladenine glycosylase
VAKDLLGKFLVRRLPDGTVRAGKIVETEAYIGPEDRASHAFGGKVTPRNRAEWMVGGHVYIYLVYGMYFQFNISTGREGSPECVLIRALELAPHPALSQRERVTEGRVREFANGPGKLCQWLKLSKAFYGEDMTRSKRLWVEHRGVRVPRTRITAGPRVGIDYAGRHWAAVPWRFWIKDNPAVSRG